MGGGGKSTPSYQQPAVPAVPTLDDAKAKREAEENEARERKRKAAIAASGRGSTILAGDGHGDNASKTLGG